MFFMISHVFFRVCFWDVKTTRKILPFMSMQITKKQKFSDVCGIPKVMPPPLTQIG